MTIMPVVSILMPVLNEEATVAAAIRSILDQNVGLEVIVADAGSTDGTLAAIASLRDDRITVYRNPKRNIPSGLNIALSHARGTYVARVDAHAIVDSHYLTTAIGSFEDPSVGGVGGVKTGVAGTPTGRAIAVALSSRFGVGNSLYHYGEQAQDTDHAAFGVYRTSVARMVGGWDEALAVNEDVDFDFRIRTSGYRIRFEPAMVVAWNVRETLSEFARQYRRYGRGKGQMVRKNGLAAIKVRHLAAPMLVLECGVALVCMAIGRRKLGAFLVSPYAAGVTLAGISAVGGYPHRSGDVTVTRVAAAFMVMHFSWGLGFLENILLGSAPALGSARESDS